MAKTTSPDIQDSEQAMTEAATEAAKATVQPGKKTTDEVAAMASSATGKVGEAVAEVAGSPPGRAVQAGARDARKAVEKIGPAVERGLSTAVYDSFYCVSYGVVFAALAVANVVPTRNAMGRGLKDGAEAAAHWFEMRKRKREAAAASGAAATAA